MGVKTKTAALLLFFTSLFLYAHFFVLPFNLSSQQNILLDNLSGQYDQTATQATFHGKKYTVPKINETLNTNVLGASNETPNKLIEVDLANQRLYAYEDGKMVFNFLVSTGLWGKTPTGEFDIWIKLKSTTMSGGNKALGTYYYLPNVPYTMFFYNEDVPASRGFGIHGTYWHDNFGTPMSHGCINMKTEEVEQLFYWADPSQGNNHTVRATSKNPGTKVIIYGKAP
jgi:hypothetical protein